MGVKMIGVGKSLPKKVVTNEEISKYVETNHDWIVERTGICERRVATTEKSLDLAKEASEKALEGIDRDSINFVVVATITPDHITPSMGAEIKKALKLNNAVAFDINAACSGFIYAMWIAESLMNAASQTGGAAKQRALIIGTERLTRITNWQDRETCILFGDGAGAGVLEKDDKCNGILGTCIKNYDDDKEVIKCKANYINSPFWEDDLTPEPLEMKGRAVFKFAINAIDEVTSGALKKAELTYDDVDWFVLHQANGRIIQSAAHRLKQPIDKFQISIQDIGNISSATVPMALYDLNETGKLKKGDKIALVGFGGGLCAAAAIIEW